MNENIDKVIAEIGELKEKNDANRDALIRKKSELQKSLAKQKKLGIFKIIISAFTMIATCVVAAVAPPAAPFVPAVGQLAGMGLDSLSEDSFVISVNPQDKIWADALARDLGRAKQCSKYPESGQIKSRRQKRSASAIAKTLVPIAQSGIGLAKNNEAGADKMKLAEEAIERNQVDKQILERAEIAISCLKEDLISEMFNNISGDIKDQAGKSGVHLRMSKYKLKRIIDDFKAEMFQLVQHFESKGLVDTTIKRLENTIITINDVYGLSEAYNDHMKFATYIAEITKPEATHIPADYEIQVASLKKAILTNVISQKYEQALKAFSFWSFPFYCHNTELAMRSHNSVQTDLAGKLKTMLDLVESDKV